MTEGYNRRYSIRTHETYFFFAGARADGRQVLLGLFCPNLVAFYFDADGNLLGSEQRPVPFFQNVAPPFNIYDQRIPSTIEAWKCEMDFRPAIIHVKSFWSTQHHMGIEDYPAHFHEILSDPVATEDEKADVRVSIALWDEDGQFVLQWGNDYWLDRSGRVVSS